MREPYFTHEKEELNDLLMEMRNKEPGMCIVLDEYGQTEGLITLEDIVEEIIGDIHDEFDEAEEQVAKTNILLKVLLILMILTTS